MARSIRDIYASMNERALGCTLKTAYMLADSLIADREKHGHLKSSEDAARAARAAGVILKREEPDVYLRVYGKGKGE